MKAIALAIFFAVALSACGTKIQIVKVPVPVQPARIETPVRPELTITELPDDLPVESRYVRLVETLERDLAKLVEYALGLERLIETHNKGVDLKGEPSETTIHTK